MLRSNDDVTPATNGAFQYLMGAEWIESNCYPKKENRRENTTKRKPEQPNKPTKAIHPGVQVRD
jgi:hypothetical protein